MIEKMKKFISNLLILTILVSCSYGFAFAGRDLDIALLDNDTENDSNEEGKDLKVALESQNYVEDSDVVSNNYTNNSSVERDLKILEELSNDELYTIVKEFKTKFTCELSEQAQRDPRNHLDEIEKELKRFAGNSLINIGRRLGWKELSYKKVLQDVCKESDFEFDENMSTEDLGDILVANYINNMSEEQKEKFINGLIGIIGEENFNAWLGNIVGSTTFVKLTEGTITDYCINKAGFLPYKGTAKLCSILSKTGIKKFPKKWWFGGMSKTVKKGMTLLKGGNAIGWIITGITITYDLSGPAKKVTVPVVTYIEYMRIAKDIEKKGKRLLEEQNQADDENKYNSVIFIIIFLFLFGFLSIGAILLKKKKIFVVITIIGFIFFLCLLGITLSKL